MEKLNVEKKNFEINKYNKMEKSINNWPVVYLLRDEKQLYIGETLNVKNRFHQHDTNKEKQCLKERWIINHQKATKSLVYYLESELINHAFADGKLHLINKKMQKNEVFVGHKFYGKEGIKKDIPTIWSELIIKGFFNTDYRELENRDLFKYSPFKVFSANQNQVIEEVNKNILNKENSYIEGGAGTGKTLLIIRIALNHILNNSDIKIGIYGASTWNIRTFKNVLKRLDKNLTKQIIVIGKTSELASKKIDHLLIDEAQRLRDFKNNFNAPNYYREGIANTDIEWIEKNTSNQTYFYDKDQQIDFKDLNFDNFIFKNKENHYFLSGQFRMIAGNDYLDFIKEFLQIVPETNKIFHFNKYYFKLFASEDDLEEEFFSINKKESKTRLLMSMSILKEDEKIKNKENIFPIDFDFVFHQNQINERKYFWNKEKNRNDWIEKSSFEEIGSSYVVQGKDLNYAGVIFGEEITYNFITKKVEIDLKKYKRVHINGKSPEEKKQLIKNNYYILLTRGIKGTGIYIPDKELRNRLKQMIKERIVFD